MKERFYPRDITIWRKSGLFDFPQPSKLVAKTTFDFKDFESRQELLEFLKSFGYTLDNPKHPIEFIEVEHFRFGYCYKIMWMQGVIGWSKLI